MQPKHLFFFVGRPGSGKETQSKLLADKLHYPIFTTGGHFREIIASGSYLGERIRETYEKGLLMPSWVANYMFQEFVFNLSPDSGAIFEGSARDLLQAKMIEEVCTWLGRPYAVFNLEVSEEEVLQRSLLRARDKTDEVHIIETRLAEYRKLTEPAIEYFRELGKCVEVNGADTPVAVHQAVLAETTKLTT